MPQCQRSNFLKEVVPNCLNNVFLQGMTKANTAAQYDEVVKKCRGVFENKTRDYGTAWRILRPSSLTDQLYIKAQRIRTIQEKGAQKINEDISSEFIGIINYAVMALIQLDAQNTSLPLEIEAAQALSLYDAKITVAKNLMQNKNHDYGEAWRDMRISSLADLILMKLLRTKQIEDNHGITLVSEGVDANYLDMINYAVFALILIHENKLQES